MVVTAKKTAVISSEVQQTQHPVDPMKIEQNHMMMLVQYVKVQKTYSRMTEKIDCSPLDDGVGAGVFEVRGNKLIQRMYSADQYHETKEVSQTKVLEIFTTSFNRPFTICFDKQDGTERILRGRFIAQEPLRGRSWVEDLDKPEGDRRRQVDHRTVKYLICEGVKYVAK